MINAFQKILLAYLISDSGPELPDRENPGFE